MPLRDCPIHLLFNSEEGYGCQVCVTPVFLSHCDDEPVELEWVYRPGAEGRPGICCEAKFRCGENTSTHIGTCTNTCHPPEGEPGEEEDKCGPDVTRPLKNTLIDVELTFQRWDPIVQQIRCDTGPNGYLTLTGWDIGWLNGSALSPYTIMGEGVTCSTGECARTVAVDGKCFHDWAVNYVLFGAITRLCYGIGFLPADAQALLAAHGVVFFFNTVMSWLPDYRLGDVAEKLPWVTAGFAGWPFAASPGQPASTAGCGGCPLPYVYGVNPRVFDWQFGSFYSQPVF